MSTSLGAIWTNLHIPKTFCVKSFSLLRVGAEVEAIEVGKGMGDSRMDTAAVEGVSAEAVDVPRTIT